MAELISWTSKSSPSAFAPRKVASNHCTPSHHFVMITWKRASPRFPILSMLTSKALRDEANPYGECTAPRLRMKSNSSSYGQAPTAVGYSRQRLYPSERGGAGLGDWGNGLALNQYGFRVLPILPTHTARLIGLPFHHKDPFDRMLVAQALCEQIAVVSADAHWMPTA